MRRQDDSRRRRKASPFLALEELEPRTLPSTLDGSFLDVQLTSLRADPAFQGIDGRGIGIAVIDTGVDAQNPELQGNFVHWYDAVTSQDGSYTDVAANVRAAFDPEGHGSHVAGIAASTNPDIGVAPGASLIGIRGLPGPGEPWPANRDPIAGALQWVVNHAQDFNIRVVNLSLGDPQTNVNEVLPRTGGEAALIAQLEGLGVTVVSAAGNNYADFIAPGASVPAAYSTISVANAWSATETFPGAQASWAGGSVSYGVVERSSAVDRLAGTSQRSTLPNQVVAPGQDVYSTWNGDGGLLHNTLSGTSMAAPLVSGTVALMQQEAFAFGGRYLAPAEVLSILQNTADVITDANVADNGRVPINDGQVGWDQETALPETGLSYHRVNAYRALQAVRQLVGGAAPTTGGDASSTIAQAIALATLVGTRSFTYQGTVGRDGLLPVGPNDVDLYRVVTTSPGQLLVQLGPSGGAAGLDAYLRLFDANGAALAANDNAAPGNPDPALTTTPLPAGTYYVGVSSAANAGYEVITGTGAGGGLSQGDYTLTVSLNNPDPNGVTPGAVPFAGLPILFNGDLGSDPPPPGGSERVAIGPQDVDVFQVIAPDDGVLVVDTDTSAYGSQAVDTFVRAFDAAGGPIAANDDAGFGTTDSHLALTVSKGETLYVGISDYWNQSYDPANPFGRSAQGTGGLYDVILRFDNGDQNGTIAAAVAVGVGQEAGGTVGSDPSPTGGRVTVGRDGSKDVDFFAYTPQADGLLDLRADGQDGFSPALSLWAYDATRDEATKIADRSGPSAGLIYQVQAGLTYYVAVTGLGNNDFQWYAPGSGTGGQTGTYTLASALRPTADLALLSDGMIRGSLAVQDVTLGARVNGTVGRDGNLVTGAADVDLYRFVAPATETIAVSTDTAAEGSSNTVLRVFDDAGHELAANDDADAGTTGSLVIVTVEAGRTYYFGVNGSGPQARAYDPLTGAGAAAGSTGNYILSVTDGIPPQSRVAALPAFSPAGFTLSWSGEAFSTGATLAGYDVFVSDNGGPFTPFLQGTTQTSAEFRGETGHTYGFYSLATDSLGHRQVTPTQAQASTRVDETPPTSSIQPLPAVSLTANFTVSWSGADDAGGSGLASYDVFVSTDGGPYAALLTGTTLTSAPFTGSAGHSYAFYSVATDQLGNREATPAQAQATTQVGVAPTPGPDVPSAPRLFVTGADAGGGPDVKVFDAATGRLKFGFFAYEPTFGGGVRVAVGDVNGDGTPDAVTVPGPGRPPEVHVYDGTSGALLRSFDAFGPGFLGGLYAAAGDVNADGFADVVVGADAGGGANVAIFDGKSIAAGGPIVPLADFFPYGQAFTGGVRVAAGDVNADGHADLICGAGPGGGPNVTVISGADGRTLLASFFPYAPAFTGGVYLTTGDVNGDGRADIVCGTGPGGGPNVTAISGADFVTPLASFFAYDAAFTGGVRVGAVDRNGDGITDLVCTPGPGGGPDVRTVNGLTGQQLDDFFAYDPRFAAGLFVAGG